MPTIHELYDIYANQLDSIIMESELLLQREGGLDGELKTSGTICEQSVKSTLQTLCIPRQFRLVTGYIATPLLLREKKNLPQCDILIVDNHVPPIFKFLNSEIEVVPRESVCGLIEVKRSLTKESLYEKIGNKESGALAQLKKTIDSLGESSTIKSDQKLNRFNRYVGLHNHSSDKPLLGVISIVNRLENFHEQVEAMINTSNSLVDFVWSFDGFATIPVFRNGDRILNYAHIARPKTETWSKLTAEDFRNAESRYYKIYEGEPVWGRLSPDIGGSRVDTFARMIGMISLWLSRTFGAMLSEGSINDYYLRHK